MSPENASQPLPGPLHPPLPPTKEGLNNYKNSWELNLGPIQEGKGKVV